MSYNKRTSKLDTIAAQMKEEAWSEPEEGVDRQGVPIQQQYAWIKHPPRRGVPAGTDFCAAKCDAVVASVFWIAMIPGASGRTPSRPGPLEIQAVRSCGRQSGAVAIQLAQIAGPESGLRAALCLPVEMGTHIESKSRLRRKR